MKLIYIKLSFVLLFLFGVFIRSQLAYTQQLNLKKMIIKVNEDDCEEWEMWILLKYPMVVHSG